MSDEGGINFNKKPLKNFSRNILFDALKREGDSEALTKSLYSIFQHCDKNNPNGVLEVDEIKQLLKEADCKNSKKNPAGVITDKEIEKFSFKLGINAADAKVFLQRLFDSLPFEKLRHRKEYGQVGDRILTGGEVYGFEMKDTPNGYTEYYACIDIDETNERKSYKAFYDKKNDRLLPANKNPRVEIVGLSKDLNNPKIVIKGENGEKTEIKLHIKNGTFLKRNSNLERRFLLTSFMDALSNLPETVLDDLKNNVKHINLTNVKNKVDMLNTADGVAYSEGNTIDTYQEIIDLEMGNGLENNIVTLTHEIGHTVDNGFAGYATEQEIEKLNNFIEYAKDIVGSPQPYALRNAQELFAEYYKYTHLIKDGVTDKRISSDKRVKEAACFFNTMNNVPKWKEIKVILDGIKDRSIEMTRTYIEKNKKAKALLENANNAADSIKREELNFDTDTLWDAYNEDNVRTLFEKILPQYPGKETQYYSAPKEGMLDIVTEMRNHPEFKDVCKKLIKKIETIDNKNLSDLEQKFNKEQKRPLSIDDVEKVLKIKPDLLSSDELRALLKSVSEYETDMPSKIKEQCRACSNEASVKEIVTALRNQYDMYKFLNNLIDNELVENPNTSWKDSLDYLKKTYTKGYTDFGVKPRSNAQIEKLLTDYPNLLKSDGLRQVVIKLCEDDNPPVPKVFKEKFQEGSEEPITKEIFKAILHSSEVTSFLSDNGYKFKKTIIRYPKNSQNGSKNNRSVG